MEKDFDELEFPHNEPQAHAEMIRMSADFCEEGDYVKCLDIIDEVRGQLLKALLDKEEKEEGSGVFLALDGNRPRMAIMRPDWDNELDNYFKHE
jgi:hypothetical protein